MATLKPVYQDWQVLVFSTAGASSKEYLVAHRFNAGLELVQPTAFLRVNPSDPAPLLSLQVCWLRRGRDGEADSYRLEMTAPGGQLAFEQVLPLPDADSAGLSCDTPQLGLAAPLVGGEYTIAITPFSQGSPLGVSTFNQPIQVLETQDGVEFPVMGVSAPATVDSFVDLVGYNLVLGDGFVWADLFLRRTNQHQGAVALSLQLVDLDSGQVASQSNHEVRGLGWQEGDLWHERRILWLEGALPESLSLLLVPERPLASPAGAESSTAEVVTVDEPRLVTLSPATGE
jgi:hypothetical protein